MQRLPLTEVKARLLDMRNTLKAQLRQKETEAVGALSAYDNHPADLASDTFNRELDLGLTAGLNRQLDQVKRAEEKIAEGSYGYCDRCGQPIGPQRLEAEPQAVLCWSCQNLQEEPYVGPVSEVSVVPYPWGKRPRRQDMVEPDGEDFWQAVARWGSSNSPQDDPPAVDYQETFVGFSEPVGYVEEVESVVDDHGDVLFDALREKPIRQARSSSAESDEYLN